MIEEKEKTYLIGGEKFSDIIADFKSKPKEEQKEIIRIFKIAYSQVQANDKCTLMNQDVKTLSISNRTKNTLYRRRIYTIKTLCEYSEKDIKNLKDIGNNTLKEIKRTLEEYGLSLKKV